MKKLFLVFLLSTAPASALATLVQSGIGALASNTTHGNFIVFLCGTNSATNTVTGVTDSESNTYVQTNWTPLVAVGESLTAFYALNVAGGTHDTITSYLGGGGCIRLFSMSEWSGMPNSGSGSAIIDGTSGNSGTSGSCDPGAITTTNADDVIIGGGVEYNAGTAASVDTANSFVLLTSSAAQGTEYRIVGATGSYNPRFTTTPGFAWMCIGVAFKQGSAPPPSTVAKRRIL